MLERTTRPDPSPGAAARPARRARRPPMPALQSGYCAVCSAPYNGLQEHIRSRRHQKLIGEDANYIALNGSLNGFLQGDDIPFLDLNGVDAIGVHDSSFDEFSPKYKKRAVARSRAVTDADDAEKTASQSPEGVDLAAAGHRLRSRKTVNYMSPPSDDDSMQEKPDHGRREPKEYRELRSSTKALAKLTEQPPPPTTDQEVWNSGRPKRACIGKKRPSADDCPAPHGGGGKAFYKVEVAAPRGGRDVKRRRRDDKDKALIVKFRKMRNSELVRLNDEATNFLFPQKEESDSEDEVVGGEGEEEEEEGSEGDESTLMSCSDVGDCNESSRSFKVEDDRSMDSTGSSTKGKKKRRTHAEAFIMDNQKYYKFETPGSRLRYHGSYLPAVPKSPKLNGAFTAKPEDSKQLEESPKSEEQPDEKKVKYNPDAKVKLDNYKFSFEKVPTLAPWYESFRRIDKGEQAYIEFSDYFLDPFLLPYQMPAIPPLDPRACLAHYGELRRRLAAPHPPSAPSRSPTPGGGESASASTLPSDDDGDLSTDAAGKSRKSPRQHASTLAILGGLAHHPTRRRRKRPEPPLEAIPEEPVRRVSKPRVDYSAIARQIDQELDHALDDGLENYDLDVPEEHTVDFVHSRCSLADIMRMCDEGGGQQRLPTARAKPGGRRKKTNRTGWPNKSRRQSKPPDRGGESDESEEEEAVAPPREGVSSDCEEEGEGGRLQPFVCVRKLEVVGEEEGGAAAPKRTKRRLRHMPGSPKSPRMLRKPRGRWYRER